MPDIMKTALAKLEDAQYPTEPKRRMGPIQRQLALMVSDYGKAGRQMVAQRRSRAYPTVTPPETWTKIRRKSRFKAAWDDIGNGSACAFARFIVVFMAVLFGGATVLHLFTSL